MKKFNYLLLGLAGLALASCSQDDLVGPANGDGNFNVTVKLPADLATRAVNMNTGFTATNLQYAVYDTTNDSYVMDGVATFDPNQLETTVSMNLAAGKEYKITFFADAPDNGVYTFDAKAGTMTVNYKAMNSAGNNEEDLYDCFINQLTTPEIGTEVVNTSITLYRPIAQLNWGTSDLGEASVENYFGINGEYIATTLTTEAYDTFDLIANDVDATSTTAVTLADFTQPQNAAGLAPFPVAGYQYVAMQYLLAPKAESTVYDLELSVENTNVPADVETQPTSHSSLVSVANAPVQANFRTNIYGNLLTDNIEITVVKDPNWFIPDFDYELIDGVVYVAVSNNNLTALRTGGNVILSEDVTYTSETEDAYLMINKNTNLNLNGYSLGSALPGKYEATMTIGGSTVETVNISNGTILPLETDRPTTDGDAGTATIYVRPTSACTVTLNDVTVTGSHPVYLHSANANTKIVINSGTIYPTNGGPEAVYVQNGGQVVINGGTFGTPGFTSNYLLNVKGTLLNSTGKKPIDYIVVYGGTFINFDPSNNKADGDNTNYVAPGYTVVSTVNGDDTYYTVVPAASTTTVSTQEALQAAVGTPNATIVLDGTDNSGFTFPNKVASGVTFVGTNGAQFNIGSSQTANYTNVTFKNIKFVSSNNNYVGLQHSSNLRYENCEIEGQIFLYSNGETFENCKFTVTGNLYNVWTYSANNVMFKNCSFSSDGRSVLIYNDARNSNNVTDFTFENCTFNASAASEGKAAIEIGDGNSFVVYINNCTESGFGTGSLSGNSLWNHKTTDNSVRVFVDGQEVYYNY